MMATRATKAERMAMEAKRRWEKNMQLLRNIISPKPGGEVAVDKELLRVQEEDQQVDIQRQPLEARWEKIDKSLREFHQEQKARWRRTDAKLDELERLVQGLRSGNEDRSMEMMDASFGSRESPKTEEKFCRPLPPVDGLGSYSDESHDKGMVVQRVETVDTDRESVVYPIAAICDDNKEEFVAGEETGIDSMPISIPMHVLQPAISERKSEGIGIQLPIKVREGTGVVFPDYMVCYVLCPQTKKPKEAESIPTVRQNASMRELVVIFTYLSLLLCVIVVATHLGF